MTEGWSLYLDFDGVLNNDPFLRHQKNHVSPEEHRLFDPANLAAADELIAKLPVARIIVSSSWRVGRSAAELAALLASEGLESSQLVADCTDVMGNREEEIRAHVLTSGASNFIVLDDEPLRSFGAHQFFRTPASKGLTRELVAHILQSLCGLP